MSMHDEDKMVSELSVSLASSGMQLARQPQALRKEGVIMLILIFLLLLGLGECRAV